MASYFLDPFGCVKNQVDGENMMASLNASGWEAAPDAENADLIIVNSCGFIESAKRESINAVLGWKKLYPDKKILLAGCLAQRYGKELRESLPEADFLFGTPESAAGGAAEMLAASGSFSGAAFPALAAGPGAKPGTSPGARPLLSLPGSAYVKISEGCDNRCSFCAIPLIRGGLKSRPPADIIAECKDLLARGVKELCLIGQDTGSYGKDFTAVPDRLFRLPELLRALSASLSGRFWLRLLYIHPDHFPFEILDLMESDRRILPYFDIPFQHGSPAVLQNMNRRPDPAANLALVRRIREKFPLAAVRSTLMTGFPGETEEDFAALLAFQKEAAFDWAGSFAYSREEDTPAYGMKGRVAKKTAALRKAALDGAQIPISEGRMERYKGVETECLIEEKIEGEEGLYLGRLPWQAPEVDGSCVVTSEKPLDCGLLVPVKVFARNGIDLEARPL